MRHPDDARPPGGAPPNPESDRAPEIDRIPASAAPARPADLRLLEPTLARATSAAHGWPAHHRIALAQALETLGVDVLELGRPDRAPAEAAALQAIATAVRRPVVAATVSARCGDLRAAARSLKGAARPRLRLEASARADAPPTPWLAARVDEAGELIRRIAPAGDVEVVLECGGHPDPAALAERIAAAGSAGAATVTLDGVSSDMLPWEMEAQIAVFADVLRAAAPTARLGIRMPDDHGLAVAGALAAIRGGARQVTANLDGGMATPLAPFAAALRARRLAFGVDHGLQPGGVEATRALLARMRKGRRNARAARPVATTG